MNDVDYGAVDHDDLIATAEDDKRARRELAKREAAADSDERAMTATIAKAAEMQAVAAQQQSRFALAIVLLTAVLAIVAGIQTYFQYRATQVPDTRAEARPQISGHQASDSRVPLAPSGTPALGSSDSRQGQHGAGK